MPRKCKEKKIKMKGGAEEYSNTETSSSDSWLAYIMYPLLPLDNASTLLIHNLVIQVFTAGFIIFSLILSKDNSNQYLFVSKILGIMITIFAVMITFGALSQDKSKAEDEKKSMALLNVIVAVVVVFIGTSLIITKTEKGLIFWLDTFITFTNVFWFWRNSQIVLN